MPLQHVSAIITVENIPMFADLNVYHSKDDSSEKNLLFVVRSSSFQFVGEYYVSEDLFLKEVLFEKSFQFEYAELIQRILQLA